MDDAVRHLLHALEACPTDQQALERAIGAHRRAGLVVPRHLLAARLADARSFRSRLALTVTAETPDGRREEAGKTPGEVAIPAHRSFTVGVAAPRCPKTLAEVATEQRVPGLDFTRTRTLIDDLERLALVPGLREVALQAHDGDVAVLAAIPGLEVLNLDGSALEGAGGLASLSEHPVLHELRIGFDPWLGDLALARLPRLTTLSVAGAVGIGESGFAYLERVPTLEVLDVQKSAFGDESLAVVVRSAPKLAEIDLSECPVTTVGLRALATARELTRVVLARRRLTSADVAALSEIPRLAALELDRTDLADDDLVPLGALRELRDVDLSWNERLTDRALALVAAPGRLESLRIAGCPIADLGPLAGSTRLRSLVLAGTRVTDRAIELLPELPALEELSLAACFSITDAAVATLARLRGLKRLTLYQGPFDERARARLRAALPDTRIVE